MCEWMCLYMGGGSVDIWIDVSVGWWWLGECVGMWVVV